ncbi:MAG TPA: galactokinase family protein [Candidatus Limnocylindrales bacterium]|nr:galactokinase family protein [Candidatus Limnocylindrales bacterium]
MNAANGSVVDALIRAGMSPSEAERKQPLFAAAEQLLAARGATVTHRWFVPGRIEVLGKHTDYAGGRSLLCTAERGMCVVATPRADSALRVVDAVDGRSAELQISPNLPVADAHWNVYIATVARRVARNFPGTLRGADIAIASDLPRASGMSSSSVLVTALFSILAQFNALAARTEYASNIRVGEDLAAYISCIENGRSFGSLAGDKGVGTFGGSEDHTAIICSRPGALRRYSFCPVRAEGIVPFPASCVFVIAASGVKASKTGAARDRYNRVSKAAEAVLSAWRAASGEGPTTLRDAVAASPDSAARIRAALERASVPGFSPDDLRNRFGQFLLESEEIIPAACAALERLDLAAFGELVDRSQRGAELCLGNQIPQTIELARSARALGAVAASAFGAGFGGSVWSLVPRESAAEFRDAWRRRYETAFPGDAARSEFFITAPGPPCTAL